MTDSRALVVEVLIAAPIDTVWNALRDPAVITQWFGWNHPELPEEIDYIFASEATSADEAHHRLDIGGDEFTLEAQGDKTIVRLTRAAPAGGTWDDIYDEIAEGWRTFVHQLRFTLEAHPAETRRTVYLSGRVRQAGAPQPPDALNLSGLATASAGDAYEVLLATGDHVSGRVWFRSPWQIGLVVDAFGPGLLVATRRPATPTSPHGGGMFVLTLYGFDQVGHEALTARWHAWFEAQFDNVTLQT